MEATTNSKQPQDDVAAEEAISIMMAELDEAVKYIKFRKQDGLGTRAADVNPSYKNEFMHALKQLSEEVEHDRNHFIQANDDGAHAMADLEAKVDRHAKAAIFYREQLDKKL